MTTTMTTTMTLLRQTMMMISGHRMTMMTAVVAAKAKPQVGARHAVPMDTTLIKSNIISRSGLGTACRAPTSIGVGLKKTGGVGPAACWSGYCCPFDKLRTGGGTRARRAVPLPTD